jgi:DNA-binding SARP family transcriptional activator/TolB-like protein
LADMYTLRMLGGIGLSNPEGVELDALLRQPKHIGLLAFLAMPRPGTWHRRDALLLTFWPELDQSRARMALRSALHTLRRHLAEGSIRNRGDDEVSIDPALLSTDVAAMVSDFERGRYAQALGYYHGLFLHALYIADAEEFEKWVQLERGRLNGMALKSAAKLAETREKEGDLSGAIDAARLAAELDPDDEVAARRWIALLDRVGDRTQAFAVYERFRTHVAEEFGTRPSAETLALVELVRTRRLPPPLGTEGPEEEPAARSEEAGLLRGQTTGLAGSTTGHATSARPSRYSAKWLAVSAVIIVALGVAALLLRGEQSARAEPAKRLVVLPVDNETGDPDLAYVGAGLADGVARRLQSIGGLTVRSAARADWPERTRHDLKTIATKFGTTVLLRTSISRVDDSLEVNTFVIDGASMGERKIATRRFTTSGLRNVESELAAAVAGALFRVPVPATPRTPDRAVDPESYRLTLEGWQQLLVVQNENSAQRLFIEATTIDPLNARAWSGLSSVWSAATISDQVPFDEGYDHATAAAERALALDSLQGTAWANLAILRALRSRSLEAGTEAMQRAIRAEPANPEVFLVQSALYRSAWQWDKARDAIRVARQLDPLTPYYLDREATLEICAGRPGDALKLYRGEMDLNSDKLTRDGVTRSLALLGRFDEAIASWREEASAEHNSALYDALGRVHGESGYWSMKHLEGRKRLARLEKAKGQRSIAPMETMRIKFAAGDLEGGFEALGRAERDRALALYRVTCMPDVDEVRNTPRFTAVVARVGGLPTK